MIYKDASTFNGSLPAGVACIRGDLPAANWAWDETTDDCYIMLASSYGTKTITIRPYSCIYRRMVGNCPYYCL